MNHPHAWRRTAELSWTDVAVLESLNGLVPQRLAQGCVLEMLHVALHLPVLTGVSVRVGHSGPELREADLRCLFRAQGLSAIFPRDGHEASAVLVPATIAEPIDVPFHRGGFLEGRNAIRRLSPAEQRRAFLVTHDELLSPARVDAMR